MKCKEQVEIQNGAEVVMKNGMKAMKGECGSCGTKVFRILGKAQYPHDAFIQAYTRSENASQMWLYWN